MRDLIVTEFVSLDGVMQAPGGEEGFAHSGWVGPFVDEQFQEYKLQEQLACDVLLLGRVTYDSFASAWPGREGELASKINGMRKLVASNSLDAPSWERVEVLPSPALESIAAVKREDGGPILVVGSRTLAQQLLAAGLVDELHLQVIPVVLGSGDRLFADSDDPIELRLARSTRTESGAVLAEFRVG